MFERIFTFINCTFFAFILIISMSNLGKCIGFEQMGELGISIVFGSVYLHFTVMDDKKKDKEDEKEKDGAD